MLAEALSAYMGRSDILILALPRGGVPVAYEVAKTLFAPMDLWLVRKLGVPRQEELALGALAAKNIRILNQEVIDLLNIDQAVTGRVISREQAELERRDRLYRHGRPPPDPDGKTVIIIDDGLATGAIMRVAIASLRQAGMSIHTGAVLWCGPVV